MATWPTISTYQRWLSSTPSLQECSRGGQGTEVGQQPERPHLLVSVITVVLNGADCLERCIQSVLEQGFREKEHIIIDGGSTDGTLEILRDYSDRIDCWISGPDDGIYDAMNKGIVLSRGKYIKLLNADDMLAPDSIAKAVKVFSREENTICIKGNVEVIDKKQCTVLSVISR